MASIPKSRRSGGPQTAGGKLASSRNSLKTGTYSKQEVLPGEDPKELLELEQYFMEDFAPQGVTESALVHDLTVFAWKKLRLERLEYRRLRDKLNEPLDYFEFEGLSIDVRRSLPPPVPLPHKGPPYGRVLSRLVCCSASSWGFVWLLGSCISLFR